jgi:hypothetical protein
MATHLSSFLPAKLLIHIQHQLEFHWVIGSSEILPSIWVGTHSLQALKPAIGE